MGKKEQLSELQISYNKACLNLGELVHKEQMVNAESVRLEQEINKQKKELRELVRQHERIMKRADDASDTEPAIEEPKSAELADDEVSLQSVLEGMP